MAFCVGGHRVHRGSVDAVAVLPLQSTSGRGLRRGGGGREPEADACRRGGGALSLASAALRIPGVPEDRGGRTHASLPCENGV